MRLDGEKKICIVTTPIYNTMSLIITDVGSSWGMSFNYFCEWNIKNNVLLRIIINNNLSSYRFYKRRTASLLVRTVVWHIGLFRYV